MGLQPKRMKFRKMHKGRNRGTAAGATVAFGTYGLKAVGRGRMTARQIEAARRAMTRHVKVKVKSGFGFSRTSQLLRSLLRFVKVKVRVTLSTGYAKFNLVVFFMRWKVFLKLWHAKRLLWLRQNCHLKQPL